MVTNNTHIYYIYAIAKGFRWFCVHNTNCVCYFLFGMGEVNKLFTTYCFGFATKAKMTSLETHAYFYFSAFLVLLFVFDHNEANFSFITTVFYTHAWIVMKNKSTFIDIEFSDRKC